MGEWLIGEDIMVVQLRRNGRGAGRGTATANGTALVVRHSTTSDKSKRSGCEGEPIRPNEPHAPSRARPLEGYEIGLKGERDQAHELRWRHPAAVISYESQRFTEPFKACCGAGRGPYNFDIFTTCGSPEANRKLSATAHDSAGDGLR
ncbi:hypothetical protein KSP39_PZI017131 [Platanthera zijinensis]|uniref:Uncharacterized protein n=1 Tax=Platanthera zijinensis TaxID=2320716 RepID=A0AAP0G035_9ASPA